MAYIKHAASSSSFFILFRSNTNLKSNIIMLKLKYKWLGQIYKFDEERSYLHDNDGSL